jgi:alpha-tubulin suppressor-like RCC1 family protein
MRRLAWSCLLLCLATLAAHAAPHLVTPKLPSAAIGVPYSANLLVGSAVTLTGVTVTGLPAGLASAHNGSGSISITGTPAQLGTFNIAVNATDSAGGSLNATVSLAVSRRSTTASSIGAGQVHACAVVGGGVQCWGNNAYGKLGNNSNADSAIPVQAIPAGSNATAVSTGPRHTCAVVDGGVKCWGDSSYGKLGNGGGFDSPVPVTAIAAGSGATVVSAGTNHTCAVVAGVIKCWGQNQYGQLGNNSTSASAVPVTTIMPQGSVATHVSAGDEHTCGAVDGDVLCWGRNGSGQLGNGTTTTSLVGVYAIFGKNVTRVSAGYSHSCAVVEDGVQCWGYNGSGQLGNNSTTGSKVAVQAIPPVSNVTAVSTGRSHTCAAVNGGARCWGYNGDGEVGNGSVGDPTILAPVQVIAAGSNVTSIDAGDGVSCAVVAGEARCWGSSSYGALGNGYAGVTPVAVQAAPLAGATALAAGESHTCAVAAGGVQCWGYNGDGELGDNTTTDRQAPTQVMPAGSNATEVAAGYDHTCAVVGGGVMCWGYNSDGQLGTGNTTESHSPVQVLALGPGAGVSQVAGGEYHTCAVAAGGVFCWGYGYDGQLGNGGTADSHSPVLAIGLGSGATAVAAGGSHTCAVVAGGVRCWGDNYYGQLGDNSTSPRHTPVVTLPAASGVTAIAAGDDHTCAVVAGGVKCWGYNQYGQLGNNSTVKSEVPVTTIPAGSNATAVSASADHTCAVVNGGVQCWGSNYDGQLGNNTRTNSAVPVQAIPAGSNATRVEVGNGHSCAIVSGATVCWGSGDYGQLGNPAYSDAVRPAPVLFIAEPATTLSLTVSKAGAGSGSVSSLPAGIDCGATCSASFTFGSLVVLTATPGPDSIFAGWSGACSGLYACNVPMDAAKAVTATFMPNPTPSLTVTKLGAGSGTVTSAPGGIDCGASCSNTFSRGSSVVLTAAAAAGSTFTGWGGGCSGAQATCSVTLDASKNVTASFAAGPAPANPPRLANISTRMRVQTGENVMITGFVIGGSAPKTVAVVVTGPSLAQYGITNPLANPTLTLVRSSDQAVVATNDDWQAATNATQLQAAGFAPSHALESALLVTLPPGAYTAVVQGVGGGTGTAVAAVYEADEPARPLLNISTRGYVLGGNDVMIGGFVITGNGPQTVAIVATGPSLAQFGITSPLGNPTLTLVRSSDQSVIATNDDWGSASNAAQLAASGFAPSNPLESAILVTLQPGAYTAVLSGVSGGTGVGVLAVYALQ